MNIPEKNANKNRIEKNKNFVLNQGDEIYSLILPMNAKTSTPPQAYTRETLTKAFEWMKTQPDSVKDKIVSADSLVRLYLHSKRFGSPTLALIDGKQPNLEDLISVENFKQDLKDLAQGLKQFEKSNETPVTKISAAAAPETRPSTKSVDHGRMQEKTQVTASFEAPRPTYSYQPPQYQPPQMESSMNYQPRPAPAPAQNYEPTMAPPQSHAMQWDDKTYMAIKTVKDRFNLSSDQEALRMLVATGFERLREGFLKGF